MKASCPLLWTIEEGFRSLLICPSSHRSQHPLQLSTALVVLQAVLRVTTMSQQTKRHLVHRPQRPQSLPNSSNLKRPSTNPDKNGMSRSPLALKRLSKSFFNHHSSSLLRLLSLIKNRIHSGSLPLLRLHRQQRLYKSNLKRNPRLIRVYSCINRLRLQASRC